MRLVSCQVPSRGLPGSPDRRNRLGIGTSLMFTLLLAACGGGGGSGDTMDCSIAAQNRWVDDAMRDFYLYADQVPVVDLAEFAGPETLVRALRVDPPDRFSNVADAATQGQLFDEGRTFGFGFSYRLARDQRHRFIRINAGSPMANAGIDRGEVLIAINGVSPEVLSEAQSRAFLGERGVSTTATFTVESSDGAQRDVVVTSAEYGYVTVPLTRVFERNGRIIGYLPFDLFIETARAEFDVAFSEFRNAGINELILDMRYNGGGRTSIARKLASQIGGPELFEQTAEILRFNERYAFNDFSTAFPAENVFLELDRLVVIATDSTASSSEIVVNALRPYIEVDTIGTRTAGKPFQSRARDYCERRLNAMEIISTNVDGDSVTGGIEPSCVIGDDATRMLGDPEEGMLAAALGFVTTGRCPESQAPLASRLHTTAEARHDGLDWTIPIAIAD